MFYLCRNNIFVYYLYTEKRHEAEPLIGECLSVTLTICAIYAWMTR